MLDLASLSEGRDFSHLLIGMNSWFRFIHVLYPVSSPLAHVQHYYCSTTLAVYLPQSRCAGAQRQSEFLGGSVAPAISAGSLISQLPRRFLEQQQHSSSSHQTAGASGEQRHYLMDDFKCVFFLFKILLCSLLFKSEHEMNNPNTPLTNTQHCVCPFVYVYVCLFILGMYAFILNSLYLTLTF